MSSTILCSEINKTTTYPQTISISAPNNCGTISVICDSSYTEQMVYEMPTIVIDIYIPVEGKDNLYKYRSISCTIDKDKPQSFPLTDIPETCTFYIQPNFDNYVFEAHDEEIINSESDDYWETPTTTFPISLIWNDTNIVSGGSRGSGGGGAAETMLSGLIDKSITTLDIPNGTTSIGAQALVNCKSLTTVSIPDSVTSINYSAFEYCSALTEITIPDSVTRIGNQAFHDCSALTEITIPDSVTSLGTQVFQTATSLKKITLPKGITTIPYGTFNGCAFESFTIPETVTEIKGQAFYFCKSLTEVTIPASVKTIGSNAFGACKNLTKITINKATSSISGAPWGATNATIVWTG